jgi:hypothetical protein
MEAHTAAHYSQMQAEGTPLRHCHMMSEQQWAYNDWLAETAGPDVQKVSLVLTIHADEYDVLFDQYSAGGGWRSATGADSRIVRKG